MMEKEIILLGAGGHCHSVIDVIEQEGKFKIAGIIDNQKSIGNKVLRYSIIGCDDDLKKIRENYEYALVSVGQIKTPKIRIKLFELLKSLDFKIPVIISPLAYVSKYANIEEGTVVHHHALINANAKIGKNCIINTKALIEHDTIIGNNCHISTGAIINGATIVENGTFVGSNATTKECSRVSGFIKAGSLVK
jgi:sugar O-acyltransferase (sialic acid O-acetyltransferase NeuD family)